MAWSHVVQVGMIRTNNPANPNYNSRLPPRYIEITSLYGRLSDYYYYFSFETPYTICGICSYAGELLILGLEAENNIDGNPAMHKPAIKIVTIWGKEDSSDPLGLLDFQSFTAGDFRVAAVWGESVYYICSPCEIVVAKPRDADDHVTWLLERQRFREALSAIEEAREQKIRVRHDPRDVGEKLIMQLVEEGASFEKIIHFHL